MSSRTERPTMIERPVRPRTRDLILYFLRLGTLGFGGPIALVGYMQRDLVEDRRWISREDYFEGLAFSQLCPGPLAAQLAKYLGWVHGGALGATLTGLAFILPSFLMVVALASLYVHFGQLAWIQGLFYGIGAAVSAIIVRSAWTLIQKTLGIDCLLWVLFGALAITTVWTQSEIVWLFILCGFIAMLVKSPPRWQARTVRTALVGPGFLKGPLGAATASTVASVFLFFLKAGAFVSVDSEHHRGFLLCTGNRTLAVFALDTHRALAHLSLPAGAGVVKFDPGLGRIYAACSSVFISVFRAEGSDHYRKLEDFAVQKMVHSLAVDIATHRLYTPEQQEEGQPVARMVVYEAIEPARKP